MPRKNLVDFKLTLNKTDYTVSVEDR